MGQSQSSTKSAKDPASIPFGTKDTNEELGQRQPKVSAKARRKDPVASSSVNSGSQGTAGASCTLAAMEESDTSASDNYIPGFLMKEDDTRRRPKVAETYSSPMLSNRNQKEAKELPVVDPKQMSLSWGDMDTSIQIAGLRRDRDSSSNQTFVTAKNEASSWSQMTTSQLSGSAVDHARRSGSENQDSLVDASLQIQYQEDELKETRLSMSERE